METKLRDAFAPEFLLVRDDSAQHAGHAGANPEGESHFYVEIKASGFNGKTRVARQRMVYDVLAEEMSGRVHALALKVDGAD